MELQAGPQFEQCGVDKKWKRRVGNPKAGGNCSFNQQQIMQQDGDERTITNSPNNKYALTSAIPNTPLTK